APEQLDGAARGLTTAVDVYALGAVLYELLTGRPPFRAATVVETLDQVRSQEPLALRKLQPRVPRDLETICLKCLHKEPGRRYGDAGALADDLHRFLAGEPIRARPVGAVGRLVLWCRRKPALASTLAGAVLTIAVVTAIAFAQVLGERDRF